MQVCAFSIKDEVNTKRTRKAILFARQELKSIKASYTKMGWDTAIGLSGTILSINDAIKNNNCGDDGITSDFLDKLKNKLIELGNTELINLEGLSEAHKPVFAGGVAVLYGVFEALKIKRLTISDDALREGLIHGLIGRTHNQDTRDGTYQNLM